MGGVVTRWGVTRLPRKTHTSWEGRLHRSVASCEGRIQRPKVRSARIPPQNGDQQEDLQGRQGWRGHLQVHHRLRPIRRTSTLSEASPTTEWSRTTTSCSRGQLLEPRRGVSPSEGPCSTRPPGTPWKRSSSSSSIPPPSSDTEGSRRPRRSSRSWEGPPSEEGCPQARKALGQNIFAPSLMPITIANTPEK